jgi:hypothetical protein
MRIKIKNTAIIIKMLRLLFITIGEFHQTLNNINYRLLLIKSLLSKGAKKRNKIVQPNETGNYIFAAPLNCPQAARMSLPLLTRIIVV